MRLCVPIPCFFSGLDFCDAIRRVHALGFDAAETYEWRGLDLDAVRATLDETGVELLSMCVSDFRLTTPEHRSLWLDALKRSCEAAERLGVRRLITQVGPDTGAERARQHAAIVETMTQALPILAASNVTLMPEPLNVLVDHAGYYLVTAKEGFEIVDEVNSPHVKLIFDLYHQQISEGNLIPNVTQNIDRIAHLHAAGHPGRHELQTGETDYRVVFDAIDRAGYSGACGLEYFPTTDAEESLRTAKKLYS